MIQSYFSLQSKRLFSTLTINNDGDDSSAQLGMTTWIYRRLGQVCHTDTLVAFKLDHPIYHLRAFSLVNGEDALGHGAL